MITNFQFINYLLGKRNYTEISEMDVAKAEQQTQIHIKIFDKSFQNDELDNLPFPFYGQTFAVKNTINQDFHFQRGTLFTVENGSLLTFTEATLGCDTSKDFKYIGVTAAGNFIVTL